MSEPMTRPDETEEDGLKASTNVPPDPPVLYAMMANNTGIAFLGAGAIWFCLRAMHQAFLLAMLLIVALAVANLLLLMAGLRRAAEARALQAVESRAAYVAAARAAVMAALPAVGAPPAASTSQAEVDRLRRQAAS